MAPVQRPVHTLLLDSDQGAIDWYCEAPAARVSVVTQRADPVEGPGYVERLVLSVPPWRIPIRELRWGRWISDDASRSLIWIDWRGEENRTWVFADGAACPDASVTDETVFAGPVRLTVHKRTTLVDRSLARVVAPIPGLALLLPASILELRDVKWVSRGTLHGLDAAQPGTAIHECVVFP
jgi:hypothetical protein